MTELKVTLSVDVPRALADEIDRIALTMGEGRSSVVRQALRNFAREYALTDAATKRNTETPPAE